jgi:hypothetical protein
VTGFRRRRGDGENPERPAGLPASEEWVAEVEEEALARKGADGPCSACGRRAWGVGRGTVLIQALEPSGTFVAGRGIETVVVYCSHCGLLRLHAGTILMRD